MKEIINSIRHANKNELDAILNAVIERENILYPEWEVISVALPRNDWEHRKYCLDLLVKMEDANRKEALRMYERKF